MFSIKKRYLQLHKIKSLLIVFLLVNDYFYSYFLAGGPGFEPGLAESESAVLPLDDPPSYP